MSDVLCRIGVCFIKFASNFQLRTDLPKQAEQTNSSQSATAQQSGCERALRVPRSFCCEDRPVAVKTDKERERGRDRERGKRRVDFRVHSAVTMGERRTKQELSSRSRRSH